MRCKNNAITYNFDFAILTLLGTEIAEIRHVAVAACTRIRQRLLAPIYLLQLSVIALGAC